MKKVIKTMLAFAAVLLCGGAWADAVSTTPKFLVNFKFKDGADVSGWNNWTQASGNYLGDSSGITDADSGIKFVTTSDGNFDNSYSACSQDYSSGHYVDIFGSDHASLMEEVKTSLGLGSDISSDVYNTGLMNRGTTGHTVTISGLDHNKSYVVYSGYGVYRANGYNQGFSIEPSGYTSVSKLEYVTTVAGTGTSVATQYTPFQPSTKVRPGNNGLMLVRATGIVPTTAGEIKFKLDGSHAGMNFLAIAEIKTDDDPLYFYNLNGNTTNEGSAGTENVTIDSNLRYNTATAVGGSGQSLIADDNSYIKIYNESGLVSNEKGWAISFWVNSQNNDTWANHGLLRLGDKYYQLQHAGMNKGVYIYPQDTAVANNYTGISLSSHDTWHHIAFVSNGENITIWCDGVVDSTYQPKDGQHLYGSGFAGLTGFTIGEDPAVNRGGQAYIDEVAIYAKSLTADEVQAIFKSYAHYVAKIGSEKYETLQAAYDAAKEGEIITLLEGVSGLTIPAGKTVDAGNYAVNGAITGSGTIKFSSNPTGANLTANQFTADAWTGTVELPALNAPGQVKLQNMGNTGSKIILNGITGNAWLETGNATVNAELILQGNVGFNNGSSNKTYIFNKVSCKGDYTMKLGSWTNCETITYVINTLNKFAGTINLDNVCNKSPFKVNFSVGNIVTDKTLAAGTELVKVTKTGTNDERIALIGINLESTTVNSAAETLEWKNGAICLCARDIYAKNGKCTEFELSNKTATTLREGDRVIINGTHCGTEVWQGCVHNLGTHPITIQLGMNLKHNGTDANGIAIAEDQVITLDGDTVANGSVYIWGDIGANAEINKSATENHYGVISFGHNNHDTIIAGGVTIGAKFVVDSDKAAVLDGTVTLTGEIANAGTIKFNENGQLKVPAGRTVGALQSTVEGKIAKKIETVDGQDVYGLVVTPAASVGDQDFADLAEAITYAQTAHLPVVLGKNVEGALNIPGGVTIDSNGHTITTVTGSGTIIFTGSLPTMTFTNAEWRGTVWLKNIGTSNSAKLANTISSLGNANSTVRMTNVKGYLGSGGNTTFNNAFTLEFKADDTNTFGWDNRSGWGSNKQTYNALTGDGDYIAASSGNTCSERILFTDDSSSFTGGIDVMGSNKAGKIICFGADSELVSDNDNAGTIIIGSGKTMQIAATKTWKAAKVKVIGTVKGTGTIDAALEIADGATIDVTGNTDGAALTLAEGSTLKLGSTLNLVGVAEDQIILKGVTTRPDVDFIVVKIDGVAAGRLVYDETAQTLAYKVGELTYWTPKASTKEADGVFAWEVGSAWYDYDGHDATWPADSSSIRVKLDAKEISGVKITGQISAGEVILVCSDDQDHNFEFHNPHKDVGQGHETDPSNKLTATLVTMAQYRGNLGLKVPIDGKIGFGENTHLVFRTGTGDVISTAYAYDFNTHGAAIVIDGAGMFEVPTSMYDVPFAPTANATNVYNVASGTTTATTTFSGSGTIKKSGAGRLNLTSDLAAGLTVTVAEGTLGFGSATQYGSMAVTINVLKGATFVSTKEADSWHYDRTGIAINVWGTWDMSNTRMNVNNGQTWHIYGGAVIQGAGQGNNRAFDYADASGNPVFHCHADPTGANNTITWNVTGRIRTRAPIFDIDEGVIVDLQNTQYYSGSQTTTKRGKGTLKISSGGVFDSVNLPLNVEAGHLDLSALSSGAANNLKGNLTIADGVVLHLPAGLAADTPYTLCGGTLTPPTSVSNVTVYVGETPCKANLTFNTGDKTVAYSPITFLYSSDFAGEWTIPAAQNTDVTTVDGCKTRTVSGTSCISFDTGTTQTRYMTINMILDIDSVDFGSSQHACIASWTVKDVNNTSPNYVSLMMTNQKKLYIAHSGNSSGSTQTQALSGVHFLTITVDSHGAASLYIDGSNTVATSASYYWTVNQAKELIAGEMKFGICAKENWFSINGLRFYSIEIKNSIVANPIDSTILNPFLPEDVRTLSAEAKAAIVAAGLNNGYAGGDVVVPTVTIGGHTLPLNAPEYAELIEATKGQSIELPKVTVAGEGEVENVMDLYDLYKLTGKTGSETYTFEKPNFTTPAQSVNPNGMTLSVALPTALNGTDGNLVLKAKSGEGVWKRIGLSKPGAAATADFSVDFADILYGSAKSATFKLDATTKVSTLPHDLVMLANAPYANNCFGWTKPSGAFDRTTGDLSENSGALYRIVAVAKNPNNNMVTTMFDSRLNWKDLGQTNNLNIDWAGADSFDNGRTWTQPRIMIDVPNFADASGSGLARKECDLIDPCLGYDARINKFVVIGLTGGGLVGAGSDGSNSDLVIYDRVAEAGDHTWSNRASIRAAIGDALDAIYDGADWQSGKAYFQGPGHAVTLDRDLTKGGITIKKGTPIFAMQYCANQGVFPFAAWYDVDNNGNITTWHVTKCAGSSGPHEPSMTILDDDSFYMIAKGSGVRKAYRSVDYKTWTECNNVANYGNVQGSIIKIGSKDGVGKYVAVMPTLGAAVTGARGDITVFVGTDATNGAADDSTAPVTWVKTDTIVWPGTSTNQGYTSMYMIDEHTLGVVFEACSHIYFQAVDVSAYVD